MYTISSAYVVIGISGHTKLEVKGLVVGSFEDLSDGFED